MNRKTTSIRIGPGKKCPKDGATMDRFEHERGYKPRPGGAFYFRYWDRCACGHLQHYDAAKVYPAAAPAAPRRDMTPDQLKAWGALKDRLPAATSKRRRQWLAAQMGIEERYAIIGDMDAVECATVIAICGGDKTEKAA